jgi:hypothetical protein
MRCITKIEAGGSKRRQGLRKEMMGNQKNLVFD